MAPTFPVPTAPSGNLQTSQLPASSIHDNDTAGGQHACC